jgi:DNA-binding transcriptional MerR regulator
MINFVFYENPTLTLVCVPAGSPARYSLNAAAHLCGVHADLLRHYCALGLLGEERMNGTREPLFDDNTLYEVRRIEHFQDHYGVNRQTLPVLCGLWREVDRLQAEVRFLRGA